MIDIILQQELLKRNCKNKRIETVILTHAGTINLDPDQFIIINYFNCTSPDSDFRISVSSDDNVHAYTQLTTHSIRDAFDSHIIGESKFISVHIGKLEISKDKETVSFFIEAIKVSCLE